MPIDAAHSLDEVLDAAVEHAKVTGLAPMWAVTPLAGVNDSQEDARALADLARAFAERAGVRPRVSVIPYNPIGPSEANGEADPFARAPPTSRSIASATSWPRTAFTRTDATAAEETSRRRADSSRGWAAAGPRLR